MHKNDTTLKVGVLMLTPRCDMFCSFCGANSNFSDLADEHIPAVLQALENEGINNLVLGGGEPMCWSGDLWAAATQAKARGFLVQVGSNATCLPADFAGINQIDRWVFPLESSQPLVHNAMRPYRGGHFDIMSRALESCRQKGKSVTVSTVITRENLEGLPQLADWLADYQSQGGNLHAWHLYRFQPEGRGGLNHAHRFSVPVPVYREHCEALRSKRPELNILLRPDLYKSKNVAFFWREKHRFRRQDRHGFSTVLCHLPL